MLVVVFALLDADAACFAHEIVFVSRRVLRSTAASPAAETLSRARCASWPLVRAVKRRTGRFVSIVALSFAASAAASRSARRVIVAGLHFALAEPCALQLVWHVVSPVHTGGMSSVSHFGSVNVPVQPPLHFTLAPHVTFAPASSLHSPLHVPLHAEAHLPRQFASGLHLVHLPSHVPAQLAVPPAAVFVPSHLPSQLPSQPPVVVPLHSPPHLPTHSD